MTRYRSYTLSTSRYAAVWRCRAYWKLWGATNTVRCVATSLYAPKKP